ncbi:MAG TPA: SLC13 family permease [Vicinamibacterales bacterium]|nr:SLC13 family permease [Vicinamibacterales bacterium]
MRGILQPVSPAVLSLLALVVALGLSMTSRINVGWLALSFAWLIGVYAADLRPDAVIGGFPVSLFITLSGVTLLFAVAEANGSLEALANRAMAPARGRARLIPLLLFAIACGLSSVGPGAVSTVALLAPLAMTMGVRAGLPPLVIALMVANGANAGNLSPFSAVGVIANGAMAKIGLGGFEGRVWFANFAAHVLVAGAAYAAHLWTTRSAPPDDARGAAPIAAHAPMPAAQRWTLLLIAAWIAGVIALNLHLGLSAFAAAAIILLTTRSDESAAVKRMPWSIIMMVCGVSVLIALLEKTGGMDLFTTLLARLASPATLNGVIAFVTGGISTYSSTSGVVLPTFLPTAATLVERVGGGDPLAVALSINVGSSLVDVSPLSTIGALCVAAAADAVTGRTLFRAMLLWGLAMTVVGAVFCALFAPVLAAR